VAVRTLFLEDVDMSIVVSSCTPFPLCICDSNDPQLLYFDNPLWRPMLLLWSSSLFSVLPPFPQWEPVKVSALSNLFSCIPLSHKATPQSQNKTTSIPPKSHHPFHYCILIMTCLSTSFLYFNSLSLSLSLSLVPSTCSLFFIYYLVVYWLGTWVLAGLCLLLEPWESFFIVRHTEDGAWYREFKRVTHKAIYIGLYATWLEEPT